MCGIIGIASASPLEMTASAIRDLIRLIKHRGPDSDGYYSDDHLFLGHARLSIVDLSEHAAQPMWDASNAAAITFNGEIYNYLELRQELERKGVRFRTDSDTEVLIEGYMVWGEKIVERLDGMFAFCIYDRIRQHLFLARDRFGKKPLFYKAERDKFFFASDADAVIEMTGHPSALSPTAVNCYLAIGYLLEPQSVYEDIYKLRAGHSAIVDLRNFRITESRYWNPLIYFQNKRNISFSDASAQLSQLLDTAVRKRLMGNVEIGTLLSGGIDSSGIVSYMEKYERPRTFSAVFEDSRFSEKEYIDIVASTFDTIHQECMINVAQNNMVSAIRGTDQLLADNSIVAMHQLCRFASGHVKVVMAGDGGDEIFAGYETYTADLWRKAGRHIPALVRRGLKSLGRYHLSARRTKIDIDYQLEKFFSSFDLHPSDAHYLWRQHFSVEERIRLLGASHRDMIVETDPIHRFRKYYEECAGMNLIDAMQYVDIMTWLRDDILVKTDSCSMRYGLEVRSPYMDIALFEFTASLPASFRIDMFRKKIILKQILKQNLPASILKRKKEGFNVPVREILKPSNRNEYQEFNLFAFRTKYPQYAQHSYPGFQ